MKTFKKLFFQAFFIFVLFALSLPKNLFAQTATTTSTDLSYSIKSPIGAQNLTGFLTALLVMFLKIGVPLVTIFVIYSGFLFVKAQGNPGELEKAKKSIMYAVIGGLLMLGCWALATAIQGSIKQL